MQHPSKISHPLKNNNGTSQRTRIIDALQPETAPIDGKTLADQLYLICEYARSLNFYEYSVDKNGTPYQQRSTWNAFFENSLPFQLAKLSKVDTDHLERQFLLFCKELSANPSKQALTSILNFVYDKLILPTETLYTTVNKAENSFSVPLLSILKSSFSTALKNYVKLHNASATFLCVPKKNFTCYMNTPWQLTVDEVYALEACIQKVKGGKKEAYGKAAAILNTVFYQMLNGLQEIIDSASDFIEESLHPLEIALQQKHEAHLALLFTFLELFKHFQGNLNELGKKHLDFFYEQVLQLVPKDAIPDKAHVIFEVAKHLETYPLPEGLLLKDGKDAKKQDIQFELAHEIIIDKAQVKELKTLTLNSLSSGDTNYIEGMYIAPIADSLDGIGKKYKEDQPKNWPTLGAKSSKYLTDGGIIPQEHPKGRIGFLLSSPVLLLQEGKREIKILLDCKIKNDPQVTLPTSMAQLLNDIKSKLEVDAKKTTYCITDQIINESALSLPAKTYLIGILTKQNPYEINAIAIDEFLAVLDAVSCEPIFTAADKRNIKADLENFPLTKKEEDNALFKIWFSGEKEWISAIPEVVKIHKPPTEGLAPLGEIQFELLISLPPEAPAIVFYNEENLKEHFDLKDNFPVVKIEVNETLKINCGDSSGGTDPCCLKKQNVGGNLLVSPYHFLKHLQLVNAQIDVEVCGVKNLIVQNDEGTLDINSQIFPFGIRPEVPGFDPMNQVELGDPTDPVDPDSLLGPSFYIGSKEVLYKKWDSVRVNMEWKEKPDSFHDYYKAYIKHNPDIVGPPTEENFGLFEDEFQVKVDVLNQGAWDNITKMELFSENDPTFGDLDCKITKFGWEVENSITDRFVDYEEPLEFFKKSQNGFLKFTLADQDFLHKEYPFVLARQMLAYAYTGENKKLADAIYINDSSKIVISPFVDFLNEDVVIDAVGDLATDLVTAIEAVFTFIELNDHLLIGDVTAVKTDIESARTAIDTNLTNYFNDVVGAVLNFAATFESERDDILASLGSIAAGSAQNAITNLTNFFNNLKGRFTNPNGIDDLIIQVEQSLTDFDNLLDDTGIFNFLYGTGFQALIPNEPWTPIIKNLYLDYSARAVKEDIAIVHLYPFENTSKGEAISQDPTLFPYFDDEGTLFIGFDELSPGGTLSLLFQLAEATADSEQDRANINWHYLSNNSWIALQEEFDVLDDATDGLTVSGIVTIAIPDAISNIGNTVMPSGLYWIKVSAPENVLAVAEAIGIHTQAAKVAAKLNENNDTARLETPIKAGSIGKLVKGDFSVKKVVQPYDTFGGRKPEAEGHFYTRVSEQLKHKGRALMSNDYEKIVLESFPEIYKTKCISHTMGLSANIYRRDLEVAPGFVVVAVIPDLTKLMAGNQLEPKAPVSLLEKIGDLLREKTSPFARLKVMNPRYEFVDVCVEVRLYRGKSSSFYAQQLKDDLTFFLAPWFLGDTEKLAFGEEVLYSDLVGFIEQLAYVAYIADLRIEGECNQSGIKIQPLTARSILTAGEICVKINEEDCPPKTPIEIGIF